MPSRAGAAVLWAQALGPNKLWHMHSCQLWVWELIQVESCQNGRAGEQRGWCTWGTWPLLVAQMHQIQRYIVISFLAVLYRSLRRHKMRLNEYVTFLICKRGAYIIFHPTFKFDDEIRAGGGRSGVYSTWNIAHYSVIAR